jgi:phosphatidate cytidylyltransferase
MALHLQTLKTRTLTSVVFVIIMLCGLLINSWSFLLLFCIIHFGCWFEYQKIVTRILPAYKITSSINNYAIIFLGFGFMLWMTNDAFTIGVIKLKNVGFFLMLINLSAFIFNIVFYKMYRDKKILSALIIGFIYISVSCGLMLNLRTTGIISGSIFSLDFGLILPLLIIASMWINDTMAYIVGSLIGKTPLSSISPKKTWEGTIGGVILAVIVITIFGNIFFKADVLQLVLITSVACIAGITGDLFESKLKRLANIKDSGNIMPGHGGFLDRFDSMLMATIFVWLYVKLFL